MPLARTLPRPRTAGQYLLGASSAVLAVLVAGVALVHLAAGVGSAALVGVAALLLLTAAVVATPAGRRALGRVGPSLDRRRSVGAAFALVALAAVDVAVFVAVGAVW